MRDINKLIVHCSATREGQEISAATINKWHKKRGWAGIGYHFVIGLNGLIEYGRPVEKQGAHTKGHNKNSIGICYIGGVEAQKLHPEAVVHGHRDFSAKACPSFDATEEYKNL